MPLTAQQIVEINKMVAKEKAGDAQAAAFFASIKALGPNGNPEILALRDDAREEIDTGLVLDPAIVGAMGFNAVQIKDCKRQTMLYAKGDQGAKAFFNGCVGGMKAGANASGNMLTLRDHILEQLGWTWNDEKEKMVPPAGGEAAASGRRAPPSALRAAAAAAAPVPPPVVDFVEAVAVPVAPAAPRGRPTAAVLRASSNVVHALPPLNTEGLDTILQSCADDDFPFTAECVISLVQEIIRLRSNGAADTNHALTPDLQPPTATATA